MNRDFTAYAVENHPNDSRVKIDPDGIVQCLSSRMGTGGNNTPFVLIEQTQHVCWAVDSHPMDSRINIVNGACPSITAKLAKLASDDPLVLIKEKKMKQFPVEAFGHDERST